MPRSPQKLTTSDPHAASISPAVVPAPLPDVSKGDDSTPPSSEEEKKQTSSKPATNMQADTKGHEVPVNLPGQTAPPTTPQLDSHPQAPILPTQPVGDAARSRHATTKIKDLSPTTVSNWVLPARVIARGSIRKWENLRGEGTLQELFLMDQASDVVRATLFNAAVVNFAAVTTPGSSCDFSGGKITFAFSGHNVSTRESNLSFSDSAGIRPVAADAFANVTPKFALTRLSQLTQLPAKASVNVMGILVQTESTKRVMSAQGKHLHKRELVLIDSSNARLLCTLWGNSARDELDGAKGRPVLIKSGKIDDYMGTRGVTAGIGTLFMVDPVLPSATEMAAWYAAGVDYASFPLVASP